MDRMDMRHWYVDAVWMKVGYSKGSMECFDLFPHQIHHYFTGYMLMAVI